MALEEHDFVEWYFNIHYEAWGYFRVRWYFYHDYDACEIEPVVYWGA